MILLAGKKKKVSYFYLLLITMTILCNYWFRRQGRYFRTVPKPCDSCVFPLLFSPPQGWSHVLKEQPAFPAHNYSQDLEPQGLQLQVPAWAAKELCGWDWCSRAQKHLPLLQPTFSAHSPGLGKHPKSLATFTSPGQTSLNVQNGPNIHAPWPKTSQPGSFHPSAEFHQNPPAEWK